MSQSIKSGFAYLSHAKHTIPIADEGGDEEQVAVSIPVGITASSAALVRPPINRRQKYTTAISEDVRDGMIVELTKMRKEGKRMTPADLIEDLLRNWLKNRGVYV